MRLGLQMNEIRTSNEWDSNRFKPSSKIFYWPFQGRTSFVDLICFFLSCVCYVFVSVCLYVLCGHLLGKGWPLGSRLLCLTVSLSLFHWYPESAVVLDCIYWFLIFAANSYLLQMNEIWTSNEWDLDFKWLRFRLQMYEIRTSTEWDSDFKCMRFGLQINEIRTSNKWDLDFKWIRFANQLDLDFKWMRFGLQMNEIQLYRINL